MGDPERKQRRRKRRWGRWVMGVVGVVVLFAVLAGPSLAGRLIKGKLVAAVAERTNATLRVGRVVYLPPFGVKVEGADFIVADPERGGELEMLKIERIELKLERLPFGPGPLMIKQMKVDAPTLRLINTDHGVLMVSGPVRTREEATERASKRLSELFELRHFGATRVGIRYEDRTRPESLPMVWEDLNVNIAMEPKSAAVYAYDLNEQGGGVGSLRSSGTFDIDNLVLDAQSLGLDVVLKPGAKESSVPAQVQEVLEKYGVEGKVGITGKGRLPLKDMNAAAYQLDFALDDGKGRVPAYNKTIDRLGARVRVTGGGHGKVAAVLGVEAASGPDVLHVDNANVALDLNKEWWELSRLDVRVDTRAGGVRPLQSSLGRSESLGQVEAAGRLALTAAGSGPLGAKSAREFMEKVKFEAVATATDFEIQPPGLEAPVHLITGAPITANQDVVRVSNLTGRYGMDQFQILTLRVPLRDLPQAVRVDQVSMTATFDRNTPAYPGAMGEWMKKLRPAGPFEVGGQVTYDRKASPQLDYRVLVHSDQGAIEWNDGDGRRVPLTRIHADAVVDREGVRIDYLEANVFGGVLTGSGSVRTAGELAWQAKAEVRDFDLRTCVQGLTGREYDTQRLAGRAFARFDASGGSTAKSIKGTGHARLFDGRLFEVRVLSDVLGRSGFGRGLVASEAAASVEIADAQVNVKRVAVGSPAVGVQGQGVIGFDRTVNMNVIVAPLGEWRRQLRQTGIPVVSAALGEVAGVMQGLVNTATRTLLYEFNVSGTLDATRVTPVPVPVLTRGAASIFGAMLGGEKGKVSEEVAKGEEEK